MLKSGDDALNTRIVEAGREASRSMTPVRLPCRIAHIGNAG
jgi:hypothetical protein